MSSSKVKLRRAPVNKKRMPKEVYELSKKTVGSVFGKGSQPLSGLSPQEEKQHLPSLLGVGPDDPMWAREVRKFWADMRIPTPIESEGLVEFDTRLDEDGKPYSLEDYVKYRFCLVHPDVANSAEEFSPTKHVFILDDPEKTRKRKAGIIKVRKEAYKKYLEVTADEVMKDVILRVLSAKLTKLGKYNRILNPDKLDNTDKDIALEELFDKSPATFKEVADDPSLKDKALLEQAVDDGAVELVGSIYQMDGFGIMGSSQEEAVLWLQDSQNSKALSTLKARLGLTSRTVKKQQAKPKKDASKSDAPGVGAGASKD